MKTFLHETFKYNQFANKQFIEIFINQEQIPAQAISLMSHVINAHYVWLNRIYKEEPDLGIWEDHDPEKLQELNDTVHKRTFILLQAESFGFPLNKLIQYRNSKGNTYENNLKDIYYHIVNHSNYHRGQVAFLLRQQNNIPPSTDYIFYKREKALLKIRDKSIGKLNLK